MCSTIASEQRMANTFEGESSLIKLLFHEFHVACKPVTCKHLLAQEEVDHYFDQ